MTCMPGHIGTFSYYLKLRPTVSYSVKPSYNALVVGVSSIPCGRGRPQPTLCLPSVIALIAL
jgi:hypothetical protein